MKGPGPSSPRREQERQDCVQFLAAQYPGFNQGIQVADGAGLLPIGDDSVHILVSEVGECVEGVSVGGGYVNPVLQELHQGLIRVLVNLFGLLKQESGHIPDGAAGELTDNVPGGFRNDRPILPLGKLDQQHDASPP